MSQEFEALPYQPIDYTTHSDALSYPNTLKNRYEDVLPANHSRVKLALSNDTENDYINASYVDIGSPFQNNQTANHEIIIACQAPLPSTVYDFWNMVFSHKVPIIVMLSKLVENKRPKCHKYWPSPGESLKIKGITVKNIYETESGPITESCFLIEKQGKFHQVTHLQLTSWEDMKIPTISETSSLIEKIYELWRDKSLPIVVHCSAGIGRTGTLLAIMMKKNIPQMTIWGIVLYLRKARTGMVQTREQYKFIGDFFEDRS